MVLNLSNAINCWGIFWTAYWISGIYLSYKAYYVNKICDIDRLGDVILSLFCNMFWTFVGTVVIFYLPVRITVDIHVIFKLLLSVLFYHSHYMIHNGVLYKRYHKKHHEFTNNSYALVALYCTWYEAIFVNLFSASLGPVLLDLETPYLYFWYIAVALNSVLTHSGFTYGWLIDDSHDKHHTHFNYNLEL